jgi:membrane protein
MGSGGKLKPMNPVKPLLRAVDRFQQRRPVLAFPIAVWKKFGDDQAGSLAALIAYYAFASIFPLLLVLITVLDIVLRHNPSLRAHVLSDATKNFPVIGPQLTSSVHSAGGAGFALVIGLVFTFLGARGVASAAQNAFNQVWEVPLTRRPGFAPGILRSAGMIIVIGLGEIITFAVSGMAGGVGKAFTGAGAYVAATAVSLLLNVGLFWLGFRLATASEVAGRDLWLGTIISAVIWQVLQNVGTYVVHSDLSKSSSLYGTFGLVLGLLAWLYLQAEVTLYAMEASAVHARKLWPRSMFPPPLTQADRRAYELYAKVQQRRAEQEIVVQFTEEDKPGRAGAKRQG